MTNDSYEEWEEDNHEEYGYEWEEDEEEWDERFLLPCQCDICHSPIEEGKFLCKNCKAFLEKVKLAKVKLAEKTLHCSVCGKILDGEGFLLEDVVYCWDCVPYNDLPWLECHE